MKKFIGITTVIVLIGINIFSWNNASETMFTIGAILSAAIAFYTVKHCFGNEEKV